MTSTERFLKYIAVDTASDEGSMTSPSTEKQKNLSYALADEMRALRLSDVHVDSCGNVIGTLPATPGVTADKLALVAHVDTSPAASGANIHPRFVTYTGADIELGNGCVLSEKQFPAMHACLGEELIVTDGTTLLGADDKAGVAEIMTAVEKLIETKIPHGELRIIFTTDEEVGRGTEGLDVAELACDWGYTVDGGELGLYEYENFNACHAVARFHGVSIHPGSAKNIMKNAATIAMEYHAMLPADMVPEKTEGYEGFIHLTDMSGNVTDAELQYIIRDHDFEKFEDKKKLMEEKAARINELYGAGTVELTLRDTYYNMRQKIEPHMHLIDRIKDAFAKCGVSAEAEPIRGGTDGAVLTWMGLPCPNLCTGGYNFHGVYEFIPTHSLELMPDILIELCKSFIR